MIPRNSSFDLYAIFTEELDFDMQTFSNDAISTQDIKREVVSVHPDSITKQPKQNSKETKNARKDKSNEHLVAQVDTVEREQQDKADPLPEVHKRKVKRAKRKYSTKRFHLHGLTTSLFAIPKWSPTIQPLKPPMYKPSTSNMGPIQSARRGRSPSDDDDLEIIENPKKRPRTEFNTEVATDVGRSNVVELAYINKDVDLCSQIIEDCKDIAIN